MKSLLFLSLALSLVCFSARGQSQGSQLEVIITKVSQYAEHQYNDEDSLTVARDFIEQKKKLLLSRTEADLDELAKALALESVCLAQKGEAYAEMARWIKLDLDAQFDLHIPEDWQKEIADKWKAITIQGFKALMETAKTAEQQGGTGEQALLTTCSR